MTFRKSILISFLLLLPVFAVYVNYFTNTPWGKTASGFIQSDMYSYIAEARQYSDGEHNGLFYSNPFDGDKNAPKIYFQPQIFLLGLFLKYTALSPSIIFMLFAFLFAWLFMFSAIRLYETFFELKSTIHFVGLLIFIYGGGTLFIAGFIDALCSGFKIPIIEFFKFDPGYGWWMLNLGRNLIYPMESYYHFLILMLFVLFFQKRHFLVCVFLFILSFSHPFYGVEFLTVFGAIYVLEFLISKKTNRNDKIPFYPIFIIVILLIVHVFYYLIFLPSFPSHQSLMNQWQLNWSHSGITLISAYLFGFLLAGISIYQGGGFISFFSDFKNRVLGVWFIVCFLFVNHNWFIIAYQPLHFDKGYVLAPLLLMGLPAFFYLFKQLKEITKPLYYKLILICILLLLLSDNISFFSIARGDRNAYITACEEETFTFLNTHFSNTHLLVSDNEEFAAKAMVYTSMRAWISHGSNTPFYQMRKMELNNLMNECQLSPKLNQEQQNMVFVLDLPQEFGLSDSSSILFENACFFVLKKTF